MMNCSEVLSALLQGAQLDVIRIYGLRIQFGFVRTDKAGEAIDLPDEAWVTITGDLSAETLIKPGIVTVRDFFERRSMMLSRTCSHYP
ncbi:MAG: hypothetical protein LBU11_09280 [Zoogloeaceae bacterium]|jgi:hypothetical protein|nr:hypothetical protein [Zoogloeaceae bacterium]